MVFSITSFDPCSRHHLVGKRLGCCFCCVFGSSPVFAGKQVSAYILGEFGHLLVRQPGCSPKEIFNIIHEKLPTVSTATIPMLLSTYTKILTHTQPPDPELQNQIWAIFKKYESCIEVEIQQRAVEYFALSIKGAALVDILADMPKFPERQDDNSEDQILSQENGTLTKVDSQSPPADLLGDLLVPLAIEGPRSSSVHPQPNTNLGLEGTAVESTAIVPAGEQINSVQPIGNIAERFHSLCLKDSGVIYEDPYTQIGIKAEWRAHHGRLVLFLGNKSTSPLVSVQAIILPPAHLKMELSLVPETIPPRAQVQCPLEVINLRPSRDVAVLDFSYKCGNDMVNVKLRLPAVLNKFLQPISISAEEFFPQWRSLSGPPLKLQEVVGGVRPLQLLEMANLLSSYRLTICPGLDPNPNNLVASTTCYSESARAMLCLLRIETDPAERTQLRMTVASGDPTLTFELKEFVKEQLVSIPKATHVPTQLPPPPMAPPASAPATLTDPGAMLAALL